VRQAGKGWTGGAVQEGEQATTDDVAACQLEDVLPAQGQEMFKVLNER
jgi:hypothetical protein